MHTLGYEASQFPAGGGGGGTTTGGGVTTTGGGGTTDVVGTTVTGGGSTTGGGGTTTDVVGTTVTGGDDTGVVSGATNPCEVEGSADKDEGRSSGRTSAMTTTTVIIPAVLGCRATHLPKRDSLARRCHGCDCCPGG